jgi:hypothetical protein
LRLGTGHSLGVSLFVSAPLYLSPPPGGPPTAVDRDCQFYAAVSASIHLVLWQNVVVEFVYRFLLWLSVNIRLLYAEQHTLP